MSIIGLLALVITVSGCISFGNPVENQYVYDKAFSKDGLSFQYPSNWKESTSSFLGSEAVTLQPNNDSFTLTIQKISSGDTGTSIKEFNDENKQSMINSNITIINETILNVNDLTVYETIATYNSASIGSINAFIGSKQEDLYVITGKEGNVYSLQFSSPDANSFDRHLPEFNQLISTIKIR